MPFVSEHEWQFLLVDNANNVLADLSDYCDSPLISPRLSNPSMQGWTLPAIPAVTGAGWTPLTRRGVAIRNGQVVGNDLLWRTRPAGDELRGYMRAEFMGALVWWTARYVEDANGQIFDGPSADGSDRGMDIPAGVIADPEMDFAAGTMLREALENTIANKGTIGLTLGAFSSTPAPGGSISFPIRNLSPLLISELSTMFKDAGVLDVRVTPHLAGTTMGTVDGLNRVGVDLPGVTFDYGTGANNVRYAVPESDADDIATMLWYELGVREGSHFGNNVTEDAPGVTVDSAGARATFGTWHRIVQHPAWAGKIPTRLPAFAGEARPWTGPINPQFALWVRRYNAELGARMFPRTIVRLTPQPGMAAEPWSSYNLGDTPRTNMAGLGLDVSGSSFRIIGWDTTPERDGPETTEPLIGFSPE